MNKLIGSYKLIDYKKEVELGVYEPWNGSQEGLLRYTANNEVLVEIKRNSFAPNISEADQLRLNLSYSGTYEIISETRLKHIIEKSSIEGRISTELIRSYKIVDDILTIEGKGLEGMVILTWQKIK